MKNKNIFSKVTILIISIYLIIPFLVTFIYSFFTEWTTLIPTGFTLKNYIQLFGDMEFWKSILRTLVICFTSVSITILVLLFAMYVVVVENHKISKYIQFICMLPYALQGVILSISIISLYSDTRTIVSNRMVMLFGAYSVLVLPYIYQGIRNNINSINSTTLIQSAQILGCNKFNAYFKIIVPNILPGIVVSALLAVSVVFGDFVLANNIAGNNYQNIQVYLYKKLSVSSGVSSAIVVVIFVIVFILTGIVLYLQKRGEKES